MNFRTRFTKHQRYSFACTDESRTQQQFKQECDVNNILKKYQQTGMLNHVNKTQGQYGNFADIHDYQENLNRIIQAQHNFNELPSQIRTRFANDPAQLIQFISDEKNRDEAIKLGLIIPATPPPTIKDQMIEALAENDKKRTKSQKPS